jgi:hypothetical protein
MADKTPSAEEQLATFHALQRQDAKPGDFVKVPPKTPGVTYKPRVNASSDDGPRATLKAKLGKLSPGRRKKVAQALRKKQGKA